MDRPQEHHADEASTLLHPVVGIGASAGGLEALREFFSEASDQMTYVVIQHLSPDHPSSLPELVGRFTPMPVQAVEDRVHLDPGRVYIIPPGHNLTCEGDLLRLIDPPARDWGRPNLSIDQFFDSLATSMGARAAAVVLSGSGSDGARGIAKVSSEGGVVLVQSPESAAFESMPASAIRTGFVDLVAPPAELAARLPSVLDERGYQLARTLDPDAPEVADTFEQIFELLTQKFDLDFSGYKTETLHRRVIRRVPLSGSASLPEYLAHLREEQTEQELLLHSILVGVTSFFRDPSAWEALRRNVIDPWVDEGLEGRERRIWVCACSTGEEAYSLAILCAEAFGVGPRQAPPVRIFATDVSRRALEVAAAGIYPATIAHQISEGRLAKFFDPVGGQYRIKPDVRRCVVFAPHDVTRQTPFNRMDLVTCRNMLIYLEPQLQRKVLACLHYALRPKAALFLGAAEGLLDLDDRFETISSESRLFRAGALQRGHPAPRLLDTQPPSTPVPIRPRRGGRAPDGGSVLFETIVDALLAQRSSCACLVSRTNRLVRVVGKPPTYMRLPSGLVTHELTKMLPANLGLSVNTALARARAQAEPVSLEAVGFEVDGAHLSVDVHAQPLGLDEPENDFALVVLADTPDIEAAGETFELEDAARRRIRSLEQQLDVSREDLRHTVEALENANEELQATNEELIASNEELQSTNEELQSLNEELHTVNAEYKGRLGELSDLHADLDGLLDALEVGVVFLNERAEILRFNAAATQVFNLTDVDVGRPLQHLTDTMLSRDERGKLTNLIQNQESARWVVSTPKARFRLATVPLGAPNGAPRLVLTIVDVTQVEENERHLLIDTLAKAIPDVLWLSDPLGRFRFVSEAVEPLFGLEPEDLLESPRRLTEVVEPGDRACVESSLAEPLEGAAFDITFRARGPSGPIWARARGYPHTDGRGQVLGAAGVIHDITAERKLILEAQGASRRLRGMLQPGRTLSFELGRNGESVEWVGPGETFLGLDLPKDAASWRAAVHPADQAYYDESGRQRQTEALDRRYRMSLGASGSHWVRDRSTPPPDASGSVSGYLELMTLPEGDPTAVELAWAGWRSTGAAEWRWHTGQDERWDWDERLEKDVEELVPVIAAMVRSELGTAPTMMRAVQGRLLVARPRFEAEGELVIDGLVLAAPD